MTTYSNIDYINAAYRTAFNCIGNPLGFVYWKGQMDASTLSQASAPGVIAFSSPANMVSKGGYPAGVASMSGASTLARL